jgi:hypothetical protein
MIVAMQEIYCRDMVISFCECFTLMSQIVTWAVLCCEPSAERTIKCGNGTLVWKIIFRAHFEGVDLTGH